MIKLYRFSQQEKHQIYLRQGILANSEKDIQSNYYNIIIFKKQNLLFSSMS